MENQTQTFSVEPGFVEGVSRLTKQHDVDWQWVRGHNGDPLNEQCNQLAQDQARARRQQTVG